MSLMGDFEKGPRSAVRSVCGTSVQVGGVCSITPSDNETNQDVSL